MTAGRGRRTLVRQSRDWPGMTMRVDSGRPRRLPAQLRRALLIQLALLLAGALLLLLGAPGFWLLLLLAAGLANVAAAGRALTVAAPAGEPRPPSPPLRIPTPAPAPAPAPAGSGDEQLRRRLQRLEDDLLRCDQRVGRLAAGRARAREESRLKSDYLTLLGRELSPLQEQVEALLQEPADAAPGSRRATLEELRDRLGDLEVLLEGIAGSEPPPVAPMAAPAPPPRRARRVLIVDDGPVNLMLARQVLEREGLEVRTATSGAEALACLEQVPFDLVLMDIYMPGMDGVEASRRWRDVEMERYPGRRSVLVALTANASAEDRKRFAAAGLDDYLAKPYRPQQLIDLVSRWLPPFSEEAPLP